MPYKYIYGHHLLLTVYTSLQIDSVHISKAIDARYCSVLEVFLFVGVNYAKCRLNHQRGLMETAKYQFELAWVFVYIPYGKDPFDISTKVKCVYYDRFTVQIEPPFSYRPEHG